MEKPVGSFVFRGSWEMQPAKDANRSEFRVTSVDGEDFRNKSLFLLFYIFLLLSKISFLITAKQVPFKLASWEKIVFILFILLPKSHGVNLL